MEDKHLDAILESALQDYRDAEPLDGIEERVLARVQLARSRRNRWAWATVPLVASAVLMSILMMPRDVEPVPPTKPQVVVAQAPAAALPIAPIPIRRATVKRHRSIRPGLPKQPQFPTPSPLTGAERSLIAFVSRNGPAAGEMLADLRRRADQPLEVQPIEIQPIAIIDRENQ